MATAATFGVSVMVCTAVASSVPEPREARRLVREICREPSALVPPPGTSKRWRPPPSWPGVGGVAAWVTEMSVPMP